jgi:hypothetical protein
MKQIDKKMKIFRYIIPVSFAILTVVSCSKIETLSDIPHIEFRSFKVFDTTDLLGNDCKGGRLNFYFEDGNGDIGLEPPVYEFDDTVDLFFTLYRKSGNVFSEVPEGDLMHPYNYRIPYMERTGQNKILKGTISVFFNYTYYQVENTDTLKYEFYLIDRAENKSDTATTNEIILSVNGLYK